MKRIAAGVDLGGTKIRSAIVREDGSIVGKIVDLSTDAQRDRAFVEGRIFEALDTVLLQTGTRIEDLAGIGIGSPGPLDLTTGTILNAPNLPSLNFYPLRDSVSKRFGTDVFVDNDGNSFALGEALFGLKGSASVVVGVTLGTGMGCGIVLDGRIYHGATGTAAEIWKTPYKGKTFEETCSGRGAEEIYYRLTGERVSAKEIFLMATRGNEEALATWKEFGSDLGRVLSFIVNLLDPEVIVLGGSVTNGFKYFSKTMDHELRLNINPVPCEILRVEKSRLGDRGGVLGAAALCFCD